MPDVLLRLLVIGAHPDDAEFHAGGLISIYCSAGHTVKMISVTNGQAGHHEISGPKLVEIRRAEAAASAAVVGATYEVWDFPDGELEPSLEARRKVIAEIRRFEPDLVLTHRQCDYHPDHRAVGQLVQDASYLVTVPSIVPEAKALRRDGVVAYLPDRFTKPTRLQGDVVIDVGEQVETLVRMFACHRSQVYEWLPYNMWQQDPLPNGEQARLAWLDRYYRDHLRVMADRYREELVATYGDERGKAIEYTEVYEISEYAAPLDAAARRRLFWFLP